MLFLDRDEKHVRARDGLADRGGVRRVVLAALAGHAVGRDELRCHQFDRVAVLPEQPRPVVRAGTGFHADQARRQLRDQRQQIRACTFGLTSTALPLSLTPCTANTFLARSIPTVIMLMDFPFRGVDEMIEIPSWHLLPFAETSPQPRDGEVPFIR